MSKRFGGGHVAVSFAVPLLVGGVVAAVWIRNAMSLTPGAVGAWIYLTVAMGLSGSLVALVLQAVGGRIAQLDNHVVTLVALAVGSAAAVAVGGILNASLARPASL